MYYRIIVLFKWIIAPSSSHLVELMKTRYDLFRRTTLVLHYDTDVNHNYYFSEMAQFSVSRDSVRKSYLRDLYENNPPCVEFNKVIDNQKTTCIALRVSIFCRKTSIQNSFVQRTIKSEASNLHWNLNDIRKVEGFMSWPVLIFQFLQVLFQYYDSRRVLDLRQNEDVAVKVKECFSLLKHG